MLEGKKINLRPMEKEDVLVFARWMNDREFVGPYFLPVMLPLPAFEKSYAEPSPDSARFIITAKDGSPAGWIAHFLTRFGGYATSKEIGYMVSPEYRRKGFASEAVAMMVDYLFMEKELVRIQAVIYEGNIGSKRSLEKAGFKKEGVMRKMLYGFGQYWDGTLYSILREDWKEPKILPLAPV